MRIIILLSSMIIISVYILISTKSQATRQFSQNVLKGYLFNEYIDTSLDPIYHVSLNSEIILHSYKLPALLPN